MDKWVGWLVGLWLVVAATAADVALLIKVSVEKGHVDQMQPPRRLLICSCRSRFAFNQTNRM